MVPSDEQLKTLAAELAELALQRGCRLVTAESCTGGWLAKVLTDLPGSSVWFDRGYVTYSNAAKQNELGVSPSLLADSGAVSQAVALAMATGALQAAEADLAVAITGIAGPDGGSDEKPVGTVWFAWARAATASAQSACFAGDREAVRRQAVQRALVGLSQRLLSQ